MTSNQTNKMKSKKKKACEKKEAKNETNEAKKWEKKGWEKRRKKQINDWKVLKWASYRIHPPKPHNSSAGLISFPFYCILFYFTSNWFDLILFSFILLNLIYYIVQYSISYQWMICVCPCPCVCVRKTFMRKE